MSYVIELPGICPLCYEPVQAGELTAVYEDGQTVHGSCWAASQGPVQNNNSI